jgi:hypothetical protein
VYHVYNSQLKSTIFVTEALSREREYIILLRLQGDSYLLVGYN